MPFKSNRSLTAAVTARVAVVENPNKVEADSTSRRHDEETHEAYQRYDTGGPIILIFQGLYSTPTRVLGFHLILTNPTHATLFIGPQSKSRRRWKQEGWWEPCGTPLSMGAGITLV